MTRRLLVLIGALLALWGASLAAEELTVIYDGSPSLPNKVVMGDWGFLPRLPDNTAPFKPQRISRSTYALKLASLGRYQGTRFDFQAPLDTAPFFESKTTYLEILMRATDEKKAGTDAATPAAGGSTDAYSSAAMTNQPTTTAPVPPPVPGGPGMPPPPGGPGAPGAGAPGEEPLPANMPEEMLPPKPSPTTVPAPMYKNLRFSFFTEKGQGLLVVTPEMLRPVEAGKWLRIDIPLSLLNPALPVGGKMSRLVISSDEPMEMLVNRIAIVRDTTPMTVNTFIFPGFLEAGQRIFFAARVTAGLSKYEVQWSFDAKNDTKVDATGERVTHIYDLEGTYTVTCTVRDINGGKEPISTSLEVKVSRPR
jgi:hypothetical protein